MESLKTNPDIVTYSLAPIHNLVGITGPQRESLRKAISDYIMEKALRRNCSCPSDSKRSPGRECDCICSDNASKNINCCPSKWGLAKVVVTVRYAFDLWGDYLTKTDAFVKISLGMVSVRTHTIWNNNNPNWGSRFDLDVLELSLMSSLKVEVWDEDNKHDDDLLGACQKPVSSGLKDHICYFDHGTVTFRVSVQCLPHLTGSHCREYAASTT